MSKKRIQIYEVLLCTKCEINKIKNENSCFVLPVVTSVKYVVHSKKMGQVAQAYFDIRAEEVGIGVKNYLSVDFDLFFFSFLSLKSILSPCNF